MGHHSNWQRYLDEVFIKINGERFYLWHAVDHEGEVFECFVPKRRTKTVDKKFLIKKCEKTDIQKTAGLTSCHPRVLNLVKLTLLTDNFATVDQTIDVKTHTYHSDDENV